MDVLITPIIPPVTGASFHSEPASADKLCVTTDLGPDHKRLGPQAERGSGL